MKKLISLLLLTSIPFQALADQVVYLPKDTPAPYTGYLFDREKAEKIRLLDLNYQEATKKVDYYKTDNDLYEKRLVNLRSQNDNLAQQNVELRENSIWSKLGFFVLGAAATTAIAIGVSRGINH